MHVAYLADGHNYHVKKWVRALAEEGMRVTLITLRPPGEQIPGVSVVQLPIRFGNQDRYSYINFVLSLRAVNTILADLRPDVLLGSYATHYGWLAARTQFRPFILQTWTFDLSKYPFEGLKRFIFGPIVRYALSAADTITTDGSALAEFGRTNFPLFAEKMIPVRWGIRTVAFDVSDRAKEDARVRLGIPPGASVVTSPRGLLPVYQPIQLLRSIQLLLEERENLFVVILTLGHTPTEEVRALLDEIKKNSRVKVYEQFVESEEMRAIWNASNIVVSVPNSDGISESILESLYAGAHVIMSDIPSNKSLVQDGVQATIVNDPLEENLIAELRTILDQDKSSLKITREKNHHWVAKNGSVSQTAKQMREIFQNLIQTANL